jgi:predicted Zn-dependent peptidase
MLLGFLGTQSDKTSEGCAAMAELLTRFPEKPEKFENAKAAALRKKEASYILFRQFPHQVHKWEEEGIAENPMDDDLAAMRALTFDDVREFYRHAVGGKPLVITVVGDKRRIDLQSLERDFHVIELKYKDIIHE